MRVWIGAIADAKSLATVAVGINAIDTVAVTTVTRQQPKVIFLFIWLVSVVTSSCVDDTFSDELYIVDYAEMSFIHNTLSVVYRRICFMKMANVDVCFKLFCCNFGDKRRLFWIHQHQSRGNEIDEELKYQLFWITNELVLWRLLYSVTFAWGVACGSLFRAVEMPWMCGCYYGTGRGC